jgi:sugar phosphate isomerase/epimerase
MKNKTPSQSKSKMVPTLFSVSYAGLWGQHKLDLIPFIKKAAQLGYPAIQLMGKRPHLSIVDTSERQLEEIKKAANDAQVEIAVVAAYNDFTSGRSSAEVPFIEMQVAYVRTLASYAKKLGAKLIRIFTGYTVEQNAYANDWNMCVKAIRECAAAAQEYGVIIGLQNHHDIGVSWEGYAELLNDVDHPNCKAAFDPWSPALHGDDLYKCAKLMAPKMVMTTLADYIKLRRFAYQPGLVNYQPLTAMVRAVPLGDGFIDLESFFKGLRDGGFAGYVVYEMCSPLRGGGSEKNLDKTAEISLQKIIKLI